MSEKPPTLDYRKPEPSTLSGPDFYLRFILVVLSIIGTAMLMAMYLGF